MTELSASQSKKRLARGLTARGRQTSGLIQYICSLLAFFLRLAADRESAAPFYSLFRLCFLQVALGQMGISVLEISPYQLSKLERVSDASRLRHAQVFYWTGEELRRLQLNVEQRRYRLIIRLDNSAT